jgi:uncharacterized protein (DUF433 family)
MNSHSPAQANALYFQTRTECAKGWPILATVNTSYIQERDGVLFVGDTRVTLSSLIAAWRNEGYTAEELRLGFPALSLAQVYGAIAYYLDHQADLDVQFRADDERYQRQRDTDRASDPAFYQRLDDRRARL